jgi:hypothetical protein
MESWNKVYFSAKSQTMTIQELTALTKLIPTEGCNRGEVPLKLRRPVKFSYIQFQPNPEPDEFEDKLRKLLTFLEKDAKNVKFLAKKTYAAIIVVMEFYYGNSMLGMPYIDKSIIKRMSYLNLGIEFDFYVSGVPFK